MIDTLRNEKKELEKENNARIKSQQSNFDKEKLRYQDRYDALKHDLQEKEHELDLIRRNNAFLEKEVLNLKEDLKDMTKSYQSLHKKLEAKSRKIETLKERALVMELASSSLSLSTEKSPDVKRSNKELNKLRKQLAHVTELSESQADQLAVLGEERTRCVSAVNAQMELLSEYEYRFEMAQEDNSKTVNW